MADEQSVLGKREFLKATAGGSVLFTTVGLGSSTAVAQESPRFEASNFSAPSSANVGQDVTATVTIRNTQNAINDVTVTYLIGGGFVAEDTVQIEGGESRNISLRGSVPNVSSGEKTQGIYLNESDSAAVSSTIVINPSAADFIVESVTEFSREGRAGDSVSITAVVANRGGATGTTDLQYRIGNRVVGERRDISFDAGERRTVTLSGSVPSIAAGTYQQGVFIGTSQVGSLVDFRVIADQSSFVVDTLSAPSQIQSGDSVTARASVRNTGSVRGTQTFRYRIDGTTVASRQVTLDSGESQTLDFQGTVPDRSPGTYQQGVFVGDSNTGRTATVRIDEGEAAQFDISNLRAPSEAEVDTEITVTASVTNNGDTRGETSIEYRIDGTRIDRTTVDIRAGRTEDVEFTVTVPNRRTGIYEQGVFVGDTQRGQTRSLRIRPRAIFRVSQFTGPREATVGDQVTVEARVRNEGESTSTRAVQYRIGNRVLREREIQLESGQVRTVTFQEQIPNLAPGNYVQGVFVGQQSSTAQLRVNARPEPRPMFSISEFNGEPEASVGESVVAEARIRNTGNADGPVTVEYRIGNRILGGQQIRLAAGDGEVVTIDAAVPTLPAGTYDHGIYIAGTTRGATGRIRITRGEARFGVSNLQAPPAGNAGEDITVEATITNTGNAAGETAVEYRFDDDRLERDTVSLDADEEEDLRFDVQVPDLEPGTYTHGVFIGSTDRGQTSSFSVETTPSGASGPGFGAGTVAGGAAGTGLLTYLHRRYVDSDAVDGEPSE
jgi:uncharacterized membrane protein